MDFRSKILKRIEKKIITQLVIENPDEEYQNQIAGYENLDQLKLGATNTDPITISSTGTTYKAPRRPNLDGYNTPLRALHCRPIQSFDVTGLRASAPIGVAAPPGSRSKSKSKSGLPGMTPQAFLHIISGEKDIYWPQRNAPNVGRLDNQIEYLKIGIDCVLRDETGTDPALKSEYPGNGEYWWEEILNGRDPMDLPSIQLQQLNPVNPLAPSPTNLEYQPQYHKTINEQAVGFVTDMERLLNPGSIRLTEQGTNYTFGPNNEYEAQILNTNLAIWGMLPEAGNAPTDTVRCIFELEVHYPKVYDC